MATASGTCTVCPLPLAAPEAPRPILLRLADLLIGWLQRSQERRMLADVDDRMLRDVGIDRADLQAEAAKPFWRP